MILFVTDIVHLNLGSMHLDYRRAHSTPVHEEQRCTLSDCNGTLCEMHCRDAVTTERRSPDSLQIPARLSAWQCAWESSLSAPSPCHAHLWHHSTRCAFQVPSVMHGDAATWLQHGARPFPLYINVEKRAVPAGLPYNSALEGVKFIGGFCAFQLLQELSKLWAGLLVIQDARHDSLLCCPACCCAIWHHHHLVPTAEHTLQRVLGSIQLIK